MLWIRYVGLINLYIICRVFRKNCVFSINYFATSPSQALLGCLVRTNSYTFIGFTEVGDWTLPVLRLEKQFFANTQLADKWIGGQGILESLYLACQIKYTGCSLHIVVFFLKILWFFWTLSDLLQRWCSTCLACVHTLTPRENRERQASKMF